MRILVIMKRFSSNKDQIMQNFGREVRLFSEISKLGQTVTMLCADQIRKERKSVKLNGMKVEIHPFSMSNMLKFTSIAAKMAKENDVVVGTTHQLLGYIAHLAATKAGRKMAYDLRDNYETYNFTNIPFLKKGLLPKFINGHVISRCDLAICVSESLRQKVAGKTKKQVIVVQNGVNAKLFRPLDRNRCRKKLGISEKAKLIIYTGHISRERGAHTLIEAFKIVQKAMPDARLLLSGNVDKNVHIEQDGILYQELAMRKDVPVAINCADVAVLPQPDNETTRYTFPYKLMEYLACNVPIVATAIGDVKDVLSKYPESLCKPDDENELAQKMLAILRQPPKVNYKKIVAEYSWENLSRKLNSELVKLRR